MRRHLNSELSQVGTTLDRYEGRKAVALIVEPIRSLGPDVGTGQGLTHCSLGTLGPFARRRGKRDARLPRLG